MGHRGPNSFVVFESDRIEITRRVNKGRDSPAKIGIEMLTVVGRGSRIWSCRKLDLTIDELFDLTEALDDLCDQIEDQLEGT